MSSTVSIEADVVDRWIRVAGSAARRTGADGAATGVRTSLWRSVRTVAVPTTKATTSQIAARTRRG